MKHKLEFPLFYLVWVATVAELFFSLNKDSMLPILIAGGVSFVGTFAFVWANTGMDDIICMLLKPVMTGKVITVLVSTVMSRSPLMLCVLVPELLILWQVERGYKYERTYES